MPPSSSSRRVSRRGFLAASAIAVPAARAVGTSGFAIAAPTRRAGAASSAIGLTWHDITNQTVNAASFPEPVTQSRTWAVSWLAAARAVRGHGDGDYAVAAFAQALHDTLVAQVPSQQASLDASLAATLASVPAGRVASAFRRWRPLPWSGYIENLAEHVQGGRDPGTSGGKVDRPDTPWHPDLRQNVGPVTRTVAAAFTQHGHHASGGCHIALPLAVSAEALRRRCQMRPLAAAPA